MNNTSTYSLSNMLELLSEGKHRAYARRFWSSTTRGQSLRVFGRLNALNSRFQVTPEMIITAVYAVHYTETASAHSQRGSSLGLALRKLGGGSEKADEFPAVERHFMRLISSDNLTDISEQLRRFAIKLRTHSPFLSLDYQRLLWDLREFLTQSDKVKLRWAADFWQAPLLDSEPTPTDA